MNTTHKPSSGAKASTLRLLHRTARAAAVVAVVAAAIAVPITAPEPTPGSAPVVVAIARADCPPDCGPGGGGTPSGPPGGGTEFVPPSIPAMPSYEPGRGQPPLDQNNGISIYNSTAPQPSQAAQPGQAPVQNQDGTYNRAANGEQQPNNYQQAPNNQQPSQQWQKLSDQLNSRQGQQEEQPGQNSYENSRENADTENDQDSEDEIQRCVTTLNNVADQLRISPTYLGMSTGDKALDERISAAVSKAVAANGLDPNKCKVTPSSEEEDEGEDSSGNDSNQCNAESTFVAGANPSTPVFSSNNNNGPQQPGFWYVDWLHSAGEMGPFSLDMGIPNKISIDPNLPGNTGTVVIPDLNNADGPVLMHAYQLRLVGATQTGQTMQVIRNGIPYTAHFMAWDYEMNSWGITRVNVDGGPFDLPGSGAERPDWRHVDWQRIAELYHDYPNVDFGVPKPNVPSIQPNWAKPPTLDGHFRGGFNPNGAPRTAHGPEFGSNTPLEYALEADRLWARRATLQQKYDSVQCKMYVYDGSQGVFGSFVRGGGALTVFKPRAGQAYFDRQPGISSTSPMFPSSF